ncbi:general odorant-binding protein 69a [Nasonia vitripennis]|uniref:Putative odorant binding protein 76 n=1 Tax=Nasonia vitripennis TaxID=7425 RepID=G8B1T1_NASVI|nr:general odorant-binding protein 69a [Nasonia vitripennis]CCD17845.1 putative odorant binding protein 76 [Nasonia vitripennis]
MMQGSLCALVVLSLVCLVRAGPPDWISAEILEMVQSDKGRCMAEHGTTEALIDDVNKGNLPNDKAITCYMYCLFEAFSLVDEEANIEVEMLVGFLPEHMQAVANELIDVCAKLDGADVCDKMYVMAKCVMEKRPDLWFML